MRRLFGGLIVLCVLAIGWVLLPHPIVHSSSTSALATPVTRTLTNTRTPTPTRTPTNSRTSTRTPTNTRTPTSTRTPTNTRTSTITRTPTNTRTPTKTRTPTRTRTPTQTLIPTLSAAPGFAVGDSVMLGAARELQRVLPGLTLDAKVSRNMAAAIEILRRQRTTGQLGQFVIVHIGDNGYIKPGQFAELMDLLVDVPHVVVMNLKEPRRWEEANNLIIADTVRRYPNAVLVDWRAATINHPEYFGTDGIHIGTVGARVYTLLVLEQLRPFLSTQHAAGRLAPNLKD